MKKPKRTEEAVVGLNWSRGLFRLWAVLTAAWLLAVAAAGLAQWEQERRWEASPHAEHAETGPWLDYQLTPDQIKAEHLVSVRKNVIELSLMALIPPAALFLFGLVGLWVWRGLRQHEP
jgi:hypothetical protein